MIPEGFKVSEIKSEQTIETGLVVIAPDDSEFVWVPVPENELNLFAEQDGTSDESGNPNMRGKLWEFTKDGVNTGTEIPYSSTGYREPDIVADYDNDINNLNTINGILNINLQNATDLKNLMQKEYNDIYNSVKEYHGFYIGRYETGDLSKDKVVSKKGNEDIGNQTWYTMYAKEKKYATQLSGTSVKSNMIYGSQWDATMRWFAKSSNNFVKTYPVNAQNSINANFSGERKSTGSVGTVNNVYDMAGNIDEWTAESNSANSRIFRAGSYLTVSNYWYAGYYSNNTPDFYFDTLGSRISLYIKDPYISSKANEIICSISAGDTLVRNYYKYNDEEAITGIMFFSYSNGIEYTAPLLVSKSKDAVTYYTNHDKKLETSSGSIQYKGETYYYSSIGQWFEFFDYTTNFPVINTTNTMFTNMEDAALRLLQMYYEE